MPSSVNADALVNVPPCANQESLSRLRGWHQSSMATVAPGRAVQVVREASRSNRTRLRSTPQAYPEVDPSLRITRWHGMATAILFAAQAPAAAHRVRSPDPLRELGITNRRAERDVLKRLPDPLLKCSAARMPESPSQVDRDSPELTLLGRMHPFVGRDAARCAELDHMDRWRRPSLPA